MNKRRYLQSNQEVILIYDVNLGFIQQSATFKEYRSIIHNDIKHDIPVFVRNNEEILGNDCFWILPSDIKDDLEIFKMQYDLIGLQLQASELALSKGYVLPEKIKDKEIRNMATQNAESRIKLIEKLGYDPLDFSWVEKELPQNELEKKWFKFQREAGGRFDDQWDKTTSEFNQQYGEKISPETAYNLCLKWKRYLIGAWNTLTAQNPNVEDWKTAARKFEERHRLRQERMEEWSEEHKKSFPMVKVKKPIRFRHGPHFTECLKNIPKLFVDYTCFHIKENVVLQVVSYDRETRFIQLDFTPDIREKIKPTEDNYEPWKRMKADYDFDVHPEEIDDHLEILGIAVRL